MSSISAGRYRVRAVVQGAHARRFDLPDAVGVAEAVEHDVVAALASVWAMPEPMPLGRARDQGGLARQGLVVMSVMMGMPAQA